MPPCWRPHFSAKREPRDVRRALEGEYRSAQASLAEAIEKGVDSQLERLREIVAEVRAKLGAFRAPPDKRDRSAARARG
jgi:hypothetical protein